jgi:hypothetical protein
MKLIDRSLFLLTIGHLLIAGALWKNSELISFMRTDCIAVSVIIGALIVQRTSALTRLMLGVLIYVLSWVAISVWTPGISGRYAWSSEWRSARSTSTTFLSFPGSVCTSAARRSVSGWQNWSRPRSAASP